MPTVIPEINSNQLYMLQRAGELGAETTTFYVIPDPVKDMPDEFFRFSRAQEDINELIKLELMADTTKDEGNVGTVTAMEEANKRKFRAISITNYGMVLFGQIFQESKGIN